MILNRYCEMDVHRFQATIPYFQGGFHCKLGVFFEARMNYSFFFFYYVQAEFALTQ